jgi:PAS domain S-box-containing protein
MAENITNGLIIVEDGKIVYVNDQACRICGYPREELISLWGPDLTAPEDMYHKDQVLQETRKTGVYPEEVDTWISRKDGTRCCVNLRFSFGYSVERRHTGYVLITDITERKRAEEAMQETMNFLDSIIESSLDPIVIGNHLAHIARANKAFVQLLGYEPAELVGKHLGELFPPEPGLYESSTGSTIEIDESFYSKTYETMGRLIEEGSVSHVEFYYLSKHGLLIPVEQTMFYVCDKKGYRIAAVAICRDISERKKAEKTILDTRNFMEDVIRTSADGIVVADTLTTITMMNEAAERILGYSKEELLGRRTHDFIPGSEWDERDRLLEEVTSGRKSVCSYEHHWIKKDGQVIDLGVSIGALRDATGRVTGLVACARDITEHKAADKKLYEYQDQLRSLASQLTLAEEQERRHIATEIHDRISQSLALAKIKLGALGAELSLKEENANLAAIRSLLEQCIHDTRSLMFDLSPPFLYEFGLRKTLEWLLEDIQKQYGDVRILLYQSIRELLINIVKYAQAKTATVSLRKHDRGVHVLVEDDGRGFLVNPDGFHVSTEGGGFGIFSIQERFQHLGGSIRVESMPRHGTKIFLDLPLAQPAA